MIPETDYAWAAGFIEADGCIHIDQRMRGRVNVIVVQKDPRPIERLRRIFGSTQRVGLVTRRGGTARYYRWSVSGATAIHVLTNILPYLDHKKAVAEAALELQALVTRYGNARNRKGSRGASYRVPDDEINRRAELVRRARAAGQAERLSESTPTGTPSSEDDATVRTTAKGEAVEVAEMPTRHHDDGHDK